MSVATALDAISRGEAHSAILPTCRLEWSGIEAYGEEAISELFRAAPLAGESDLIECSHACLLSVGDGALFADLYDGQVGRLWRLGPGCSGGPERSVAVPFAPDLHQERGAIQFRLDDHPELHQGHAEAIIGIARTLLYPSGEHPLHRARGFIIRAFSCGDAAAALVALHQLGGGDVRSSGWCYGGIRIAANGDVTAIVDEPSSACGTVPH